MKTHFGSKLIFLSNVLFLTLFMGCSSGDDPSGTSMINGVWNDGSTLWIFHPEGKMDAFTISNSDDYTSIDAEYYNVSYNLDMKDKLLYTTIQGSTTAAEVIDLTPQIMTLKDGKEIVSLTKVNNATEGKAPESVLGKTLAIGTANQNIAFGSNNSCTIKLDWASKFFNTRINRTPAFTYEKKDETTATLTYTYGDIVNVSSGISVETVYRCSLTLHFTAPNMGYVSGNRLEDGIEHDQDSGDEPFSRTNNWDDTPFILQ